MGMEGEDGEREDEVPIVDCEISKDNEENL